MHDRLSGAVRASQPSGPHDVVGAVLGTRFGAGTNATFVSAYPTLLGPGGVTLFNSIALIHPGRLAVGESSVILQTPPLHPC